jgi:hypothetical protein
MTDLYGGIDPRNIPSYSMGDAARYLRIPATLKGLVAQFRVYSG